MQFSNVFLATAFLFFATSMAARAQSCNPNFEGKAVLISNGASGTVSTPGSGGSNAWYIQQNGQSPPRYILRNANDSNQALTRGENGYLKMAPASDSGNDLDQLFDIVCDTCTPGGPSFAEACMIKDPENRFVCVSASRSSPQELRTLPCNPGAPFQMYAFFPY